MMQPFIVRKQCLQEDSWTNGDWRQYIAFIDRDTAVICRPSPGPIIFGLFGFALLAVLMLLILSTQDWSMVDWWGFGCVSIISFMLMGPLIIEFFTNWRWMIALHECKRRSDGSFYRDYLDG